MRVKDPRVIIAFLVAMILLIAGAVACERAPKPTPAPAPVTTPTVAAVATPVATPTAVPTPAVTTPRPTPTPAPTAKPVLPVGLKIGERFHDIHTNDLKLKCETCHATAVETYNDPLAQVSNLADRRACLSCHKEGSAKPFYGEEWSKAKVGR